MNNDNIQCSMDTGKKAQKGRLEKAWTSSPGTSKREPKEACHRGAEKENLLWRKPCIVWTATLNWVFGSVLPHEVEQWEEIEGMPIRIKGPVSAEIQSISGPHETYHSHLIDNSSELSPSRLKATCKNLFL